MIDPRDEYQRKLSDAASAVSRYIGPGDHVVLGHCAGVPLELTRALQNQSARLTGVDIFHMVPLHDCSYTDPVFDGCFRHSTTFVGRHTEAAVDAGRADYVPCFFSELPKFFREGYLPVDVAMISVSPPDDHGFMSFGVSVDYTMEAARQARHVLAEVNSQMPRTIGSSIHVSEIDALIETSYVPMEIAPAAIGRVEESIGEHVASLIPDGAILQLGIGAIPDAVLHFLDNKHDLGIHTEMFSDGVIDLYEKGIITNRYNDMNPGKMVATFLMGTRRLYRFVHDNAMVLMKPVDYTNNPCIAGKLRNLVSINSAIEVDLYGQVCADMIGPRQYSGVGGQVDFVRASSISPGGKSIIALSSTGKHGEVSKIVTSLKPGAAVTTSRYDVDTIVTEYGVARLKGRSTTERARALIAIAHPDFRASLSAEWKG